MNITPKNNNNPLVQREANTADVALHSVTLSGGERMLPYLFAAMETCWVDAILIGLAGAHAFFLPLWVPFVLIAGCYWLATIAPRGRVNVTTGATTSSSIPVIVLLIATTLFSLWSGIHASSIAFFNPAWLGNLVGNVLLLRPEALPSIGILVLVLYFCWRGVRLSRSTLEPGNVFNTVRLGVGVMIAVIVVQATTNTASSNELLLLLLIPLFLMFALIAHAFAQMVFVRTTHRSGLQGSVFSQERAILGIITAFGAILLLLSLLVGSVASPAFLANAQRIFTPVVLLYDGLANIVAFVLTLLIAPVIWLLNSLHFRLHEINPLQTPQVLCKQHPHAVQCTKTPSPPSSFDPLLVLAIKILLPILVLVLLILIVRVLLLRRPMRVTRRLVEIHESLWSWELFLTQIKAFFRALWLRLFPQQTIETQVQENESDDVSAEPTARSIREVYRAMLRWATQRGYPRKRDETPYEFRARLRTNLPLVEPEVSVVTEAYTAIRYGRIVPTEADVAHIQQTWQQLHHKTSNIQDKA